MNTLYRHNNTGKVYRQICITNETASRETWERTIVYQDIVSGEIWSRPVVDFLSKNTEVEKRQDNFGTVSERTLLICAFRYALGRRTYVSSMLCEAITHAWPDLEVGHKLLFQREIRDAIERDMAGDACDVAGWQKLLELDPE